MNFSLEKSNPDEIVLDKIPPAGSIRAEEREFA